MINKRLPIANKWQAAPICILPSGKKERGEGEGGNREVEGDFGCLGGYFLSFFEFFYIFLEVFGIFVGWICTFVKGNKFVFFPAPIPVNKGFKFTPVTPGCKTYWSTCTLGDKSRVHMQGVEPHEIALQHMWRKATRELPPTPRKFGSKTEWRQHT